MLKLLRWPAAFALLAFLIAWPIAAGLAFMVWLMARALYGRNPAQIISTLAIIAVGGMMFLSAVLHIPFLLAMLMAACMIIISYKPFEQRPQPTKESKPQVDDSDAIDVEVISIKTIYKEEQ